MKPLNKINKQSESASFEMHWLASKIRPQWLDLAHWICPPSA